MPPPGHVLIIGAGLGGPAMALALARQNIRSTIFERRATSQDIGGVLLLAPNAVIVLDKILGIEPAIRKLGYTYSDIQMHGCSGTVGMEFLGGFGVSRAQEFKGITLRRPALHSKLLELCEKEKLIKVEFGKGLSRIEEKADGVRAVFEDGSDATGDIVLGIDGIRSKVRDHILGSRAAEFPVSYTEYIVVGNIIEKSKVNMQGVQAPAFLYTPTGTILIFPTDPSGEELQWAAFYPAPDRDRKEWDEYRTSGQAIKDIQDEWKSITAEPFKTLLGSLTPENLLLWAPYATPDLPTWHSDRTCLIGDAAHAISPSAGQGTAQALEDVGLMARLLSSPAAMDKGYPAVFAHYEKLRRKRLEGVRAVANNSLRSRAASYNWGTWWVKKTGLKAVFTVMDVVKTIRPGGGNSLNNHDVTKDSIDVQ